MKFDPTEQMVNKHVKKDYINPGTYGQNYDMQQYG